MPSLHELVGLDLSRFKVVLMTEVYRTNEDGQKSSSLGFFEDPDIAEAFVEGQPDSSFHNTAEYYVLRDNSAGYGYVLREREAIKIFDGKNEAIEIRKRIMAKLTPAERRILGLE